MEHKAKINHAKRRKVREHRIEVRLSDDELAQLKNANASSIARLLRESALRAVNKQEMEVPQFTKLDRDFLLELSRIGNNINQLAAKANTLGFVDAPQLKKEAERWHKFQADVERTFLRPDKSDMKWQ